MMNARNIIGQIYTLGDYKCEVLDIDAYPDSITTEYWGAAQTDRWWQIDDLKLLWWQWDDETGHWVETDAKDIPDEVFNEAYEEVEGRLV